MGINSFYAVNVQTAAQNSGEQIVRLAVDFAAQCNPHWIETSVSFICSHLRATPRTNFKYVRAIGASSKEFSFATVPGNFVA